MKKHINKFKELTLSKKIQVISSILLTISLMIVAPTYAWFANQKKAAEMYKVKYPSALYINAAHREDQCNLKLDGININDYAKDPITGVNLVDGNGEKIKVEKYRYVFSVSGSSTNEFILQMAHTNNNLFRYTLYEAENYTTCMETETTENNETVITYNLTGTSITGTQKTTTVPALKKDQIVIFTHKANTHNENTLQVIGDTYVTDAENDVDTDLYYVRSDNPITGTNIGYKNKRDNSSLAIKDTNNSYYSKTYGDNTNVEEHSVPLYWQGNMSVISDSNKYFCKYFILEVEWNDEEQAAQTEKETDMVYFAVKRVS